MKQPVLTISRSNRKRSRLRKSSTLVGAVVKVCDTFEGVTVAVYIVIRDTLVVQDY
jgi:hypothetical protein